MFLGRLRIRGKLALLAAIPLFAVFGLLVPVVYNLVDNAGTAADTANAAATAGRVGPLLQDVQRERLFSVGYLLGVVDEEELTLQAAAVTDRLVDLRQDLGDGLTDELRSSIDKVQELTPLRQKIRAKTVSPEEAIDGYIEVLDRMIDSLDLVSHANVTTESGKQLVALDALLRMDESNTESTAILAVMAAGNVEDVFVRYHEERTEYETYLERFTGLATQGQNELYALVAAAFDDRVGNNFDDAFDVDPVKTMSGLPITTLFPTLRSFSVLGTFVEKRLVDDVTSLVAKQRQQQIGFVYGAGAVTLVVLLVVLLLVTAVARAVALPLRRLTRSAERVAEAGETELARVADDEVDTTEPVHLDVLDVSSGDEIGELARAFDRVQQTASQLVERQVFSRRNFAEMFGHIGRRTQNLVGRQVDLIDRLEMEETEPQRLQQLYRLDHMSNRLRRSADSLVVISGAERADQHIAPVRLVDVVRLALAEIEDYTRVDVDIPEDLTVLPAVVGDLVLLCAELLENATNFSPPHTRVDVSAWAAAGGGARLAVIDHGIGLPDERLADENARLTRRERLDLVPTKVLGLFVVGRLARRHNFGTALSRTAGGGLTATVDLGAEHLAGESALRAEEFGRGTHAVPGVAELEAMIAVPQLEPQRNDLWTVEEPFVARPAERQHQMNAAEQAASKALRDRRSWNAFEVRPRSLPAEPFASPAEPVRPVAPLPPVQAPPITPVPVSMSGLRQRVPGAQLPTTSAAATQAQAPAVTDAAVARDLMEAFESGVKRAQGVAGVPTYDDGPKPDMWPPPVNVPAQRQAAVEPVRSATAQPSAPGGIRPLSRRVPGAALTAMDPRPSPAKPARSTLGQDPNVVRSLVEQFESGVARALRDASEGANSEEGTLR